jgi:hypothetical protein
VRVVVSTTPLVGATSVTAAAMVAMALLILIPHLAALAALEVILVMVEMVEPLTVMAVTVMAALVAAAQDASLAVRLVTAAAAALEFTAKEQVAQVAYMPPVMTVAGVDHPEVMGRPVLGVLVAQGANMAAVVVPEPRSRFVEREPGELFVLFGPALQGSSPQQIRRMCDGTLYSHQRRAAL